MNSINKGKLVLGVSLKVFEELLQSLQNQGLFDQLSSSMDFPIIQGNDDLVITANIDVQLAPVKFRLKVVSSSNRYTTIQLFGRVKLSVSSPTAESPDLFDIPFQIHLKMSPVLKTRTNQAPVLALSYGGIDFIEGPLPASQVEAMIQAPEFMQLLNNFELDLIEPAMDSLEEALFFNEAKPNHADWAVGLHLMQGSGDNVDAVGLVIDVPGGDVSAPSGGSFVPKRAEIITQFTDSLVQALVEEAREELRSWFEDIKGVDLRVTKLNLTVDDRQLFLDAKFTEKEYDAEVTMKGPIYFQHSPGSLRMQASIRDVKIDIDLPWWADFLVWLADILTLGTIGINDTIHNKLPNFAQNYAQKFLDQSLSNLGNSLSLNQLSFQGVNLEIYPDLITLEDGAITVYIQVINKPIEENLLDANYSKLRGRFMMFHLQSGRRYMVNHLASFMQKGLIKIPGYHQVDGRYIRSNPDERENNNLEERYSRD